MFAENVFPPIPSEAVLPLAGYLVAQGDLTAPGVLVGEHARLGRRVGRSSTSSRAPAGARSSCATGGCCASGPDELDRAETWFTRRGPVVVLVGRCIPGVRSLVSLPAGLLRMSRPLYIGLTLAGTLVWNSVLVGAGWLLGENWTRVGDVVGPLSAPLLAAVLLALAAGGVIWWRRREQPAG